MEVDTPYNMSELITNKKEVMVFLSFLSATAHFLSRLNFEGHKLKKKSLKLLDVSLTLAHN